MLGALAVMAAVGCGSQENEPVRLAKLIAAEVPKAREAWQEAGQPNLFLRPGWPKKLFAPIKDNAAIREVQVGVRYVDDTYLWTGFAASLYGERRIDYPELQGKGPGRTTFRVYDARARGFDSYALLDPEGGPYSEPIEAGDEPGTWIWERKDGVAVRVDAEDGTPVVVFYDSAALEEETALPKGMDGKASSAASGAELDALLKGIQAFREAEAMLPSDDVQERITWARREGAGHDELNAELKHLTKQAPEGLLGIRVSRLAKQAEVNAMQGRPAGLTLGVWQREGSDPVPRSGRLLARTRAGDWILTALKDGDRRWVEASTWITWKDVPIRVVAFVALT